MNHTVNKEKTFGILKCFISAAVLLTSYGCSLLSETPQVPVSVPEIAALEEAAVPSPDPREGLGEGLYDAEQAIWNLEVLSQTPTPEQFVGKTNSDLAFQGKYAFQGNYNGVIIWDISDPKNPVLVRDYVCPASQSDVSVYGNLMFVSGEGLEGRLDCGTEGVQEAVSADRLRGIRIFDISNIEEPEYIANVQTCRGSHTHSVLKDPNDNENLYVYVSGSYIVRPNEELEGCSGLLPADDPNSALFRIEVIKVPLDNPQDAAIVSSPRIFEGLTKAPEHGLTNYQKIKYDELKEQGEFVIMRRSIVGPGIGIVPDGFVKSLLNGVVAERGGEGEPTAEDTLTLRATIQERIDAMFGGNEEQSDRGPDQCHDITLYPEIGLAGGACEGYGLLLDISDPANPVRIDAVADSNFAYWHSATFNNDGDQILFTDEWGGGGAPKCGENDPYEWGANAIFTIEDGKMKFKEYYKMPAVQTEFENCVAHNGSLIPVPDRDIMVQSWYQGGISVFDFTDPNNPTEIAFHDYGPVATDGSGFGGSWSVYWYNGYIVNSEIARGLDIFDLAPSPFLTENEIAAAKTVQLEFLNAQGQPKVVWPQTMHLAKAYVDQLDRDGSLSEEVILSFRQEIANAEASSDKKKARKLKRLAKKVAKHASNSSDIAKVEKLAETLKSIASM